jgi:hypothetical protein
MREITITNGLKNVTGTLVLEHTLAWQIAVGGAVKVYQKDAWREGKTEADFASRFGDLADELEKLLGRDK